MSAFVTLDHQEAVHCLRCGSRNVHAEKRGWNLATGLLRSDQIMLTCLKCGYRFRPGQQPVPGLLKAVLIAAGLLATWWFLTNGAHAQSTTQRDAPTLAASTARPTTDCPDPNARCLARDNPSFYKQADAEPTYCALTGKWMTAARARKVCR